GIPGRRSPTRSASGATTRFSCSHPPTSPGWRPESTAYNEAQTREPGGTGLRGSLWDSDRLNLIRVIPAKGLLLGLPGSRRRKRQRTRVEKRQAFVEDRKSTRLNSSHVKISYAVFCLKKKKKKDRNSKWTGDGQ